MRDGRGTPCTCLARGKGEGDDLDKLLCRLTRTQESPGLSGSPCRIKKPAVDENAQSQPLSLEMKNDLREVSLLLHDGDEVFPYLKESLRRNPASTAAQSQTVDLFFAPAREGFAGVSCGVQGAQGGAWLGGEPGVADSHRGQCCKGEPRGSGPRCRRKQSGMGIPEDEPPRAFVEGPGSELEPACLHSVLGTLPHLRPEVSPSNETECVSPGHSEPVVSEQTVEYKKMLAGVKSTSNHLRITLRSLALQALEVAKRLCHS
ncbi:protein FAM220A [Rhinolophus sinicus]|uniref:protein FAM220A n=1 Tax=Rhinolophus sinicus TaxID=89399 RepID=UPI003D7BB18D